MQRLRASLATLGAEVREHDATLSLSGRKLELRFSYGGRSSPASVTVSYRGTGARPGAPKTLSAIRVREESSADVAGKSLGINREVQLGDAAFDEAYYVESASPDDVVRSVLDERARPLAQALLRSGPCLDLYDGDVVVRAYVDPSDEKNLTATAIEAFCRAVIALIDALPYDQPVAAPRARWGHWPLVAAQILGTVVAFLWLSADAAKVTRSEPSIYGFALGIGIGLALATIAARVVRGRADSLRVALEIGVPLVFGLGVLGINALPALNVRLDASPGEAQVLRVDRSTILRSSKSAPSLRVTLVTAQAGEAAIDLTMPAEYAALYAVGTLCRATRHPGRFGWPWWAALSRIEPQPTPGIVAQTSSQGTNAGAP